VTCEVLNCGVRPLNSFASLLCSGYFGEGSASVARMQLSTETCDDRMLPTLGFGKGTKNSEKPTMTKEQRHLHITLIMRNRLPFWGKKYKTKKNPSPEALLQGYHVHSRPKFIMLDAGAISPNILKLFHNDDLA